MKEKCIAITQKQIIMKIIMWWWESYKTSTRIWKDSRGMVLGSPSASQARIGFQSLFLTYPGPIYCAIRILGAQVTWARSQLFHES